MDVREFLARVVSDMPAPRCVVPLAFVEDVAVPARFTQVEPVAFMRACALVLWGPLGLRN